MVADDFNTFEVRLDHLLKRKSGLVGTTLGDGALVAMLNGTKGDDWGARALVRARSNSSDLGPKPQGCPRDPGLDANLLKAPQQLFDKSG